jgi:hypothetical protein
MAGMLIPVLALAMIQAPNPLQQNGKWLNQACKGAIRWQNAPADAKPGAEKENFDTCSAYIAGFLDGVMDTRGICTYNGSFDLIVRAYVDYMDRTPKALDEHSSTGLRAALSRTYPCPKARK